MTTNNILNKIIEMTLDGRLTIIWIALLCLAVVIIYETKPWFIAHRAKRARRIYLIKHYPNSHKYLK